MKVRDIKNLIAKDTYIIIRDSKYIFGGFIENLKIEHMNRYILQIKVLDNGLLLEVLECQTTMF